jgi:hypothetical protein
MVRAAPGFRLHSIPHHHKEEPTMQIDWPAIWAEVFKTALPLTIEMYRQAFLAVPLWMWGLLALLVLAQRALGRARY